MKHTYRALRNGLMIGCSGLILQSAHADEPNAIIEKPIKESGLRSSGDWCEWLSSKPGMLYKDGDNPFIQSFQVFGRFQWQAAYQSGEDVNGYEFSDDYTELRRLRMGTAIEFLQFFKLKANVNLADDARHSTTRWPGNDRIGWGYEDFDEATLTFDIKKAFNIGGVDALTISYGRHKFELGEEARESSKEIMTVERSAISNKVYGSYRPTGVLLNVAKGPWDVTAGIYSTDTGFGGAGVEGVDFIGNWSEGLAYFLGVGYTINDQWSMYWDFVYNDANVLDGEDNLWGYEWATSLGIAYSDGPFGVFTDFYAGDNGDVRNGLANRNRQGSFWGVVVMPYYWIVEDKLQAVVRYQYAGSSESQGIRANSRYVRRDHGPVVNVNSGRGNEHHSIYAGLNYLICSHNIKVMSGVEYEWLNTPGVGTSGDVSALTYWFAFRSFF